MVISVVSINEDVYDFVPKGIVSQTTNDFFPFPNFSVGVSDDDSESSSSRSELVRFRVILVEIVVALVVFLSKLSVVLETSLSWSGNSSEVVVFVVIDFLAGSGITGSAVLVSSSSSSSLIIMRKKR